MTFAHLTTTIKVALATTISLLVLWLVAAPVQASETATTTEASAPDTVAILITGAIILAVVLGLASWISHMLGKRG